MESPVQTMKQNKVALVRLVLFLIVLGVLGVVMYQFVGVSQDVRMLDTKVNEINTKLMVRPTVVPTPSATPSPVKLRVR